MKIHGRSSLKYRLPGRIKIGNGHWEQVDSEYEEKICESVRVSAVASQFFSDEHTEINCGSHPHH